MLVIDALAREELIKIDSRSTEKEKSGEKTFLSRVDHLPHVHGHPWRQVLHL